MIIFRLLTILILFTSLVACKSKQKAGKTKRNKKGKVEAAYDVNEQNRKLTSDEKKILEKYATLTDAKVNDLKNIALYKEIDAWWGTPYQYGGKEKSGIDCSNFVSVLLSRAYKKKILPPSYSMLDNCNFVERNNLKEGDLVFFTIERNRINHVGLYLVNNRFVHASTSNGVRIDDLNNNYYKKYYFKAGRPK
jgi:lipoprotein Spr